MYRLLLCCLLSPVAASLAFSQSSSFQPSFQMAKYATGCPSLISPHVVLGDFNGDHKPDLAVLCANGSMQIAVLLGDGNGGFKAPITVNASSRVFGGFVAADLNGDGKTDLLYGQQGATGSEMNCSRYLISGQTTDVVTQLAAINGTLGSPTIFQTGTFLSVFGAADLNGDGIPDLILTDSGLGIAYAAGQKSGGFSSLTSIAPASGAPCYGPVQAIADFDKDGKPDLLTTSSSANLILLLNKGGGAFNPVQVTSSNIVTSGQTADFNGDGISDLLVQSTSRDTGAVTYAVQLGKGSGAFEAPTAFPPTYMTVLSATDVNGDGNADLVQAANTTGLAIYLSNGDGSFQQLPVLTQFAGFTPMAVGDFNGDGKQDLVGILGGDATDVVVLLNTSTSTGVTGAVNGASFAKGEGLTAGALVSLFGTGFTTSNTPAEAQSIPLPTSLGGVSVTVGGVLAPLLFVSSNQINLQVPWEVSGNTANIVVTAGTTVLPVFQANIAPVAPGLFTTQSGVGQVIAINPDGSLAGPSGSIPGIAVRPAKAGDPLVILATGMGAVTPTVADGANTLDATRFTVATPTVKIGGVAVTVTYSGLAPQFVGVNQINVTVPNVSGVVPLQIQAGGVTTSSQATIAVSQ
jgi:uncharacterized protein (TIGR03437 family)